MKMYIVWIVALFIALNGHAQDGLALVSGIATAVGVAASHPQKSSRVASDQIKGKCELMPSQGIGVSIACNGIEVVLLTKAGEEVARVRTDSMGGFLFTGLNAKSFDLSIRSEKYQLDRPLKDLASGNAYLISLRSAK